MSRTGKWVFAMLCLEKCNETTDNGCGNPRAANHRRACGRRATICARHWRTSVITKNSDDQPMCVMTSNWDFNNGVQGTVAFKWTKQNGLFVHVSKFGWKLSKDTEVPMTFAFDNGVREATGYAPYDGYMIQSTCQMRRRSA
jgi:hypothetical protein